MKKTLPIICILMAVLIVVIGMTTVSFSWFEPDVKEGVGLAFSDTTQLRSKNCTVNTYEGTLGNKIVEYNVSVVANANVTVSATTSGKTTTPGVKYYKTVITNQSDEYDTVVSLYLPTFTVSQDGTSSLGVSIPTNSYRTFNTTQTDLHIVRNAFVSKLVASDSNPGQLVVEWFVKCDNGSATFNPSQAYIMYN